MNCSICARPIVLSPSAAERAKKYGKAPEFYTKLFTVHADCLIAKRNADTLKLMQRIKEAPNENI